MLCAEDEQSRTCWMTAFRLLKVSALVSFVRFESKAFTADDISSPVFTVWDCPVPELQCAPAEKG